jgi:hypothetical protein
MSDLLIIMFDQCLSYTFYLVTYSVMSRVIGYGLFLHQCYKLSIHVKATPSLWSSINTMPGILSGEVLQWYNHLSACRILSFISLYSF